MKFKNWFKPSFKNRQSPYLIQKVAMLGMFILVLLSFALVNIQALFWQTSDWLVGAVLPAVVVDLTNSERAELDALPIKRNVLLDKAAEMKAKHMAQNNYFAHYSPDGISPWYWLNQVSYQYAHAGENLAVHFTDSEAVVEAWMNSPSHRANIVNTNYTEIGVGTAKGTLDGFETVFVVQLFGTPAAVATAEVVDVVVEEPAPVVTKVTEPVKSPKSSEQGEVVLAVTESAPEAVVLSESAPLEPISTYIATTSGLPAAQPETEVLSDSGEPQASWWQGLATSPSRLLQSVYLTVGMVVLLMLVSSVAASLYRKEPRQVAYGLGLLVVMVGLFYLHVALTGEVLLASTAV